MSHKLTKISLIALAVLALMVAVLFGLGYQRMATLPPVSPITPAADTLTALPAPELASAPLATQDFLERPLFWESRRPAQPIKEKEPVIEDKPANNELEDLKVFGLYSDGVEMGLIVEYEGERRRIRQSDDLSGWRLTRLRRDGSQIQFTRGDDVQDFSLEHAFPDPGSLRRKMMESQEEAPAESGETLTKEMDRKIEAQADPKALKSINQRRKSKE